VPLFACFDDCGPRWRKPAPKSSPKQGFWNDDAAHLTSPVTRAPEQRVCTFPAGKRGDNVRHGEVVLNVKIRNKPEFRIASHVFAIAPRTRPASAATSNILTQKNYRDASSLGRKRCARGFLRQVADLVAPSRLPLWRCKGVHWPESAAWMRAGLFRDFSSAPLAVAGKCPRLPQKLAECRVTFVDLDTLSPLRFEA